MSAAPSPRARLTQLAMQLSRDKSDTLLLIGATVLVLAPHAPHLPLWVSLLCAATLGWRALITFRGTRMPSTWLLMPLALMAAGGVYLTFKTVLGRDAGVAMAIVLLTFKMLEMRARRDLFVVIFLNFFLLLTNFFYSQGIGTGFMMLAAIIALLTAQLSFQYTGAVPPLARRLRLGATILGIAAPLAIALFFLFPRIQGPLWGMPGDANSGRTGLSNSMAPGNIANLAQSAEIAFRARFNGPPPAQHLLYWRAIVLDAFDGRTWTQTARHWPPREAALARGATPLTADYEVTLEPNNERWLFALDMASAAPVLSENSVELTRERELRAEARITQRERYTVRSSLAYRLEAGTELAIRERWLSLPRNFNPRAMQAGLELQRLASPAQRAQAVLNMFRRENFSYTLQPPLLGTDSVDEFLFHTRAGFCEHYASAFVFLMRAADVPARVVAGYQGGELNPVDGYMEVRQSDAHAWAEVWLGERGWVRVDPTAAVAPERVQRSQARATPSEPVLSNLINFDIDRNGWLAQLRFRLGAIDNGWNQWVLNYNAEQRRSAMAWLEETFGNWRALAGLALACALIAVARARRLRREIDPIDALYSALSEQLSRLGLRRAPDEGPNAWAQRIAGANLPPPRKEAILHFLQLVSAHKYGAAAPQADLAATLKRLLNTSQ